MIARTATLEQSSHNLLKHCLAGAKRLAFSFKVLYTTLVVTLRGVAQLIARSVWDREVEGLSPFTPTNMIMVIVLDNGGQRHQKWCLFLCLGTSLGGMRCRSHLCERLESRSLCALGTGASVHPCL